LFRGAEGKTDRFPRCGPSRCGGARGGAEASPWGFFGNRAGRAPRRDDRSGGRGREWKRSSPSPVAGRDGVSVRERRQGTPPVSRPRRCLFRRRAKGIRVDADRRASGGERRAQGGHRRGGQGDSSDQGPLPRSFLDGSEVPDLPAPGSGDGGARNRGVPPGPGIHQRGSVGSSRGDGPRRRPGGQDFPRVVRVPAGDRHRRVRSGKCVEPPAGAGGPDQRVEGDPGSMGGRHVGGGIRSGKPPVPSARAGRPGNWPGWKGSSITVPRSWGSFP
jgi:hypothetical protein